jgi:hypothetical protein
VGVSQLENKSTLCAKEEPDLRTILGGYEGIPQKFLRKKFKSVTKIVGLLLEK